MEPEAPVVHDEAPSRVGALARPGGVERYRTVVRSRCLHFYIQYRSFEIGFSVVILFPAIIQEIVYILLYRGRTWRAILMVERANGTNETTQ